MEGMMEFKITKAEAREMARFEEEAGCDISAGTDWVIHLDKVIELALNPVDLNYLHNIPSTTIEKIFHGDRMKKIEVDLVT
jgi:predicted transcriptional regulator